MQKSRPIDLPNDCNVAYKEWAGVCHALETGRQSILLRKGGIAESGGVFRAEHSAFWLYPTMSHQSQQGLKVETPISSPPSSVSLSALAVVEDVFWTKDERSLEALDEWHVWTRETIHNRFVYRHPGIWVMSVRIYLRQLPFVFEEAAAHSGCKTWVILDERVETLASTPALNDEEAERRRISLQALFAMRTGETDG